MCRDENKVIPITLTFDEVLVRGIVHPLFYSNSKNKLKDVAFLPPPERTDVSLLRLAYTTLDFCKKHSMSLKIGENAYCGIATFSVEAVDIINRNEDVVLKPLIKASPIDENGEYTNDQVYTNSPGLPMHADLIYPSPMKKGEPATEHRKFARKLAEISNFSKDE